MSIEKKVSIWHAIRYPATRKEATGEQVGTETTASIYRTDGVSVPAGSRTTLCSLTAVEDGHAIGTGTAFGVGAWSEVYLAGVLKASASLAVCVTWIGDIAYGETIEVKRYNSSTLAEVQRANGAVMIVIPRSSSNPSSHSMSAEGKAKFKSKAVKCPDGMIRPENYDELTRALMDYPVLIYFDYDKQKNEFLVEVISNDPKAIEKAKGFFAEK